MSEDTKEVLASQEADLPYITMTGVQVDPDEFQRILDNAPVSDGTEGPEPIKSKEEL